MKKRVISLVLMFVFVLPTIMLAFCGCSTWGNADFSEYEYFALTDETGKEYVFAAGETVFSGAVSAFAAAEKSTRPAWLAEARAPLLAEWIRNGHAEQFFLYLYPEGLSAYLEDANGEGAMLDERGIAFFLSAEPCRTALVGTYVPRVTAGGQELDFSVCSWEYAGTLDGLSFSVSSGDYLNRSAAPYSADFDNFSIEYDEAPSTEQYTLYQGDQEISTFDRALLPAALSSLGAGEYQMVAVLSWQKDAMRIRAGYTLTLLVP